MSDECGHVDMATADFCRHPSGCGKLWTVELKAEDGWSTFQCDDHWRDFTADDPVHGRVVSIVGVSGLPSDHGAGMFVAMPYRDDGKFRKAKRKAARQTRRRSRR